MKKGNVGLPNWFYLVPIGVFATWGMWHFFDAGFNDRFDSLSALFSGLAFAGVIGTLIYQRHELSQTQRELRKAAENSLKQARIKYLITLYQHEYSNASSAFEIIKDDVLDHPPDHFQSFRNSIKTLKKIQFEIENLTKDVALEVYTDDE